jgi:hypothetical protein
MICDDFLLTTHPPESGIQMGPVMMARGPRRIRIGTQGPLGCHAFRPEKSASSSAERMD